MSDEMPDAQACKRRAIEALAQYHEIDRGAGNAPVALQLLGQVAQVWATLATVPEPLEEEIVDLDPVVSQLLLQQPELPNLICPHGYVAQLSRNLASADERPRLKYSWTDCEICP